MENIIDISKIILPAFTSGIITFLITSYTYNKSRPLEKLEIAYNRIYYPLYKNISNENTNNDINSFINTSKEYFKKYDKYIDLSTKRLFKLLCNCTKDAEKKSIYQKLKDNIDDRNTYLRRRLGYLQPNILQLYKYTPIKTQITLWILLMFSVAYMFCILSTIFSGKIQIYLAALSIIFIFFALIFLIIRFFMFLYYKFKN